MMETKENNVTKEQPDVEKWPQAPDGGEYHVAQMY